MIEREDRAVFGEQLQQRRRGRPRGRQTVPMTVRVPEDVFDALDAMAKERRQPLHAFVRHALSDLSSHN